MSTIKPKATFKFSQNNNIPVFSITQHVNPNHVSISTDNAVHLIQATSHGLENVSSLHIPGVKSRMIEILDDSVFGIASDGTSFIIDWRLGTTISEMKLPTPIISDEVAETGPEWVFGFDKLTSRIAYGYGNFFSIGDVRNLNQNDVVFEEMHSDCIRDLTFIENGSILVSSGADGLIQFFDMTAFNSNVDPDELLLDVINLEDAGVSSFQKYNNHLFSVADDQKLRLHDLESNLMVAEPLHAADFSGAFFIDLLPNKQIAVGNVYGDTFIASLTGVENNKILYQGVSVLQGHQDVVRHISWNGDLNSNIFTSDDSGMLCMWNIQDQLNDNTLSIKEHRHTPF